MGLTGETVSNGSLLPPLPAAVHFGNPLLAKLANMYWGNEEYVNLSDALMPALEDMEPRDVFMSRDLFNSVQLDEDDRYYNSLATEALGGIDVQDLTVDESGTIFGALGTIIQFKHRILSILSNTHWPTPEDVNIDTTFNEALHGVFVRSSNGDYDTANEPFGQFLEEIYRREDLLAAGTQGQPASESATPPQDPLF